MPSAIPGDINIDGAVLNCNKGVSFDGPGYSLFRYTPQINVGAGGSFGTATADTLSVITYSGTTVIGSTLTVNNDISVKGPMSVARVGSASCVVNGAGTIDFTGNLLTNGGAILNNKFKFSGSILQSVSGSTGILANPEINNSKNSSVII